MKIHNQFILTLVLIFVLAGCQSNPDKTDEKKPPAPVGQMKPEECADKSITRLMPALQFLQGDALEKTVESYRSIYIAILRRSPGIPIEEKYATVTEMVDETTDALKDATDKMCVIERDMISAELMPLTHEIDLASKRHLNGQTLSAAELTALKQKYDTLKKLDAKVSKLCQPYRNTLGLISSEADLDASYILNGGAAPGKATAPTDTEVDELLGEGKD